MACCLLLAGSPARVLALPQRRLRPERLLLPLPLGPLPLLQAQLLPLQRAPSLGPLLRQRLETFLTE